MSVTTKKARVKFDEGISMNKSHNKKRNVGIIFEQLVRYASKAVVENNEEVANKVLKITNKFFKDGTEIYKEYRLFNALYNTTLPSESLATRIISEAKIASNNFDSDKLHKEKSSLIHEINYSFDDPKFYSQRVSSYKTLATIQRLLESWRSNKVDIDSQVIYESKLHNWLMSEKQTPKLNEMKTQDVNNLTVNIMTRKFNENFGDNLLPEQASLLKDYIFSIGKDNKISDIFESRKNKCLSDLSGYSLKCDSDIVKEKISLVQEKVRALPVSEINDNVVSRYLTLMKLSNELRG